MKKIFFFIFFSSLVLAASAQDTEVTVESNTGMKIIRGFFTQNDITSDPSFYWYEPNRAGYVPEQTALKAMKAAKDSIHYMVFGGTWCSDTQNILPKFFALTDAAVITPQHITLIGVDRSKKTIRNLTDAFNVTRVPTIIVMKDGKEIGRVVEYGKYGMFDKELGEILSQ
jgi:hypothetical protein